MFGEVTKRQLEHNGLTAYCNTSTGCINTFYKAYTYPTALTPGMVFSSCTLTAGSADLRLSLGGLVASILGCPGYSKVGTKLCCNAQPRTVPYTYRNE